MEYKHRTSKVSGKDIVCVYSPSYCFNDYLKWNEEVEGLALLDFMNQDRFNDHLKGLFLDNMAVTNEVLNLYRIDCTLECLSNWTRIIADEDNIIVYTVCIQCQKLCCLTSNLHEYLPLYAPLFDQCVDCLST